MPDVRVSAAFADRSQPERHRGRSGRSAYRPPGLGGGPALPADDDRLPHRHPHRRGDRPAAAAAHPPDRRRRHPRGNAGLVTTLALFMVGAAFAQDSCPSSSAGSRRASARASSTTCGSALFDHVQRMPIAFFTRTQTGALVSRMNNDVIGAQRAVTGTLGSVVVERRHARHHARRHGRPRVAAHAARPRAAAALRHPGQAGRPAAAGDHPRGDGPQRLDEHDDDRALRRRRGAAGQAVRPPRRRGERVRRRGPAGCATSASARAMYGRTFFVGAGPRRRGRHGAGLPGRRPAGASPAPSRSARSSPWAPTSTRHLRAAHRASPTPGST